MIPDGKGRIRLEYTIPARGLIGFRNNFLTLTSGTGILTSTFSHYGPIKAGEVTNRQNGVLVSMATGTALTYSLETLQARGKLFLEPGQDIYEGQLCGINSRDNDGDQPHQGQEARQHARVRQGRGHRPGSADQVHPRAGAGIHR